MFDNSDWEKRLHEKLESDFSLSAGSINIYSRQSKRSSDVTLQIIPDPKLGTEQAKSQIDRIAVYFCPTASTTPEEEWIEFASLPKEGGLCKHSPDWEQSNHYTYYARFISYSGELGPVSIIQPHHEERVHGALSGDETFLNHLAGMVVGFCTIPIFVSFYLILVSFWAFFNGGISGFIPSLSNSLPSGMDLTQMPEVSFLIFIFGGLPLVFEFVRPLLLKDVNSIKHKSLYLIVTFLFSVVILITQWDRLSDVGMMDFWVNNLEWTVIAILACLIAIYRGIKGYESPPVEKESRTSQISKRVKIFVGIIFTLIFGTIAATINSIFLRIVLIIINLAVISLVNELVRRKTLDIYFKSRIK